jgi:hypothetical protein
MIQFELPLYNDDDRQLLLHAADRLAEYASPDDSAVLLQRLAHRLGRVLQSADKTKCTLHVRYVLEMDGRRQPEATIAPKGYVNCNVDLLYIEEKHDLTYQVLPLWEDAGIAFDCYSQGAAATCNNHRSEPRRGSPRERLADAAKVGAMVSGQPRDRGGACGVRPQPASKPSSATTASAQPESPPTSRTAAHWKKPPRWRTMPRRERRSSTIGAATRSASMRSSGL